MELARIERYVSDLMTVSGVEKEGKEQSVGLALYHLLMSAALRDLMDDGEKELFRLLTKKLQYFFCTKLSLKERKETKKKKNFPPHPLLKEKDKKETEEKNIDIAGRRDAFKKECAQYVGQYDRQRLEDFFYYWAEEASSTGKMRFELEKTWNTEYRLRRWMNTKYSVDNTAAAIRLQKQKKQGDALERQQAVAAAEREQAEAQREAEREQDRQRAGGLDEQIAANPDGFLARVQRERQKREGKK